MKIIFQSLDVIFAKIRPCLHLNNLQRRLGHIREPMDCARRDIGGLVFFERKYLVGKGNLSHTPNDNPMLGTVLVTL